MSPLAADLLFITPEAERHLVRCARGSRRQAKGPGDGRRLMRKLLALGHESVLKHANATFAISGISRAGAIPLPRRLAGFVQESRRYVDVRENALVRPPSFPEEDRNEAQTLFRQLYEAAVARGIPKENARFPPPLGDRGEARVHRKLPGAAPYPVPSTEPRSPVGASEGGAPHAGDPRRACARPL